jgi:hypothetical protein
MKEEKNNKASFANTLREKQERFDAFHYEKTIEELEEDRKRNTEAIITVEKLNLKDKDRKEIEDRLFAEKRDILAKINNFYGRR